jgi:hypothetical protein
MPVDYDSWRTRLSVKPLRAAPMPTPALFGPGNELAFPGLRHAGMTCIFQYLALTFFRHESCPL